MIQAFAKNIIFMLGRFLYGVGGFCWSLLRPGIAFLGIVLIVAATIALTIDVTRWQTAVDGPFFQSLYGHIRSMAPATLDNIGKAISDTLHPLVWDPLLTTLLALPAWLALLLLGLGFTRTARERRQVKIFIN